MYLLFALPHPLEMQKNTFFNSVTVILSIASQLNPGRLK